MRRAGATLHHGARASHYRGLSCCGAQAPDAQAQQLWLTGPAAPRHVGSSQTRARTRVPCTGRQTLNHCATREALFLFFNKFIYFILFIYFWLCWVFVAARELPLVAASGGYSLLQCAGFLLQWLLLLRSTGSKRVGFSSCGCRLSSCGCRLSSCGSRALEHRLSSCGTRA